MKKNNPAIAVLCSIVLMLTACSVGKNSVASPKSDFTNTNELSKTCFVQLNDGSIQQYTSLKLITGVLKTPHLLADDKFVIISKDIMAYQSDKHYAVAAKILTSKKNGSVASETLPGFAVKIVSGKLNVYTRKYYNGANTAEEYFLQNGNDGYIVAYSKEVLKGMLKEDTKALEFFNSKTKLSPKSKKLIATVEMHNSGQFFSRN